VSWAGGRAGGAGGFLSPLLALQGGEDQHHQPMGAEEVQLSVQRWVGVAEPGLVSSRGADADAAEEPRAHSLQQPSARTILTRTS
jgi:hypothetical protein